MTVHDQARQPNDAETGWAPLDASDTATALTPMPATGASPNRTPAETADTAPTSTWTAVTPATWTPPNPTDSGQPAAKPPGRSRAKIAIAGAVVAAFLAGGGVGATIVSATDGGTAQTTGTTGTGPGGGLPPGMQQDGTGARQGAPAGAPPGAAGTQPDDTTQQGDTATGTGT